MTYVDDPQTLRVGDFIRDECGYDRIVSIRENMFDNPDIRFAYLFEINDPGNIPPGAIIHDVRINR